MATAGAAAPAGPPEAGPPAPDGTTVPTGPAGTPFRAVTPSPIDCYQSYYGSEQLDIYSGVYGPLLRAFRVEDNPPTSEDIFSTVSNAEHQHSTAYIGVRKEGTSCYYQVVHSISKFPATLGKPTTWDNRTFGFVGDVVGEQIATVEINAAFFAMSHGGTYENVPATFERARKLLADNPDDDFLGPFADNDAQTRAVRSRAYVPLPHRYVPLLLDRNVPVKEGFVDLSTRMEAHGDDTTCPELRDWLLLSTVRETAGSPPRMANLSPRVPLGDRALLEQRRRLLHTHLPGLAQRTAGTRDPTLDGRLSELVQEQRLTREDAERRAYLSKTPTTVTKALGSEVTATLQTLCQVASEDDLPKLWRDLAQSGKRDRQALEQALLGKARDLNMPEAAPIATPSLVKRVSSLQWAGISVDNLSEGIQPFALVLPDYSGTDAGAEAQRLANDYDVMTSGESLTTMEDSKMVRDGKAIIPVDFGEARAHLVALMLLWTVLLGDNHPFVEAYGRFLHAYTGREYSYMTRLKALSATAPPAALLLRYIQLRSVNYWRKALAQRMLPAAPNFEDVLDRLDMQDTSWIPTIPTKYWKPVTKPTSMGLASIISGVTLPSGITSTTSRSSTTTNPSLVSTSTGGASRDARSQPSQDAAVHSVNSLFEPFREKIRSMSFKAAMTKGGQPPMVRRGGTDVPMCLSYHLGGKCWSGCGRKSDHVDHTLEEDNDLLLWCQTAYA